LGKRGYFGGGIRARGRQKRGKKGFVVGGSGKISKSTLADRRTDQHQGNPRLEPRKKKKDEGEKIWEEGYGAWTYANVHREKKSSSQNCGRPGNAIPTTLWEKEN